MKKLNNGSSGVIQLDNLTKTFDEYYAVNNVSLEVNRENMTIWR